MDDVRFDSVAAVPVSEVAVALAAAFRDFGDVRAQWHGLLDRELESGRTDADGSVVALRADRVVGACLVNIGPGGVGRLGATGVVGDHRRRGLGRALVERAMLGLDAAGCQRVTLEVAAANQPARSLYRSVGFTEGRGLRILTARRSDLAGSTGGLCAEPISLAEAREACPALHPEVPAYQRRAFYTCSFRDGLVVNGVRAGSTLLGLVLQRGRALLDVACDPPDAEVVTCLAWAASELSWEMRVINVVEDDPVGDLLEGAGFRVESRALEMVWERA